MERCSRALGNAILSGFNDFIENSARKLSSPGAKISPCLVAIKPPVLMLTQNFINLCPAAPYMNVAILYSGGKDSSFAVDYAVSQGWKIEYLLSVKPTRTDCFLFHFATVEHTPLLAKSLGLRHILASCSVADPAQEAKIVHDIVVKQLKVDAVLLGGTGLQETKLNSIRKALLPYNIKVFATHEGKPHDKVMLEMLDKGYRFIITQIASDGLNKEWLGHELTKDNIHAFFERSKKYGFHVGGEGGYYDTLTLDCPLFKFALEVQESHKIMEAENAGHLVIDKIALVEKACAIE